MLRSGSTRRSRDGGIAYVGTRGNAGPVVARTNARCVQEWEANISEPGYVETEETCLVPASDGFIAHVHGYLDPGKEARHRFVKLDRRGKVVWKWIALNRDAIKIPQVDGAQLSPTNGVVATGHIRLEKDGAVHDWTAEIRRTERR